jgi:hypothetical protein
MGFCALVNTSVWGASFWRGCCKRATDERVRFRLNLSMRSGGRESNHAIVGLEAAALPLSYPRAVVGALKDRSRAELGPFERASDCRRIEETARREPGGLECRRKVRPDWYCRDQPKRTFTVSAR